LRPRVVAALQRGAGKRRPLIAHLQDLAHLVEKFSLCVVAPPAPALRKIGEVLLPTLDEYKPSARDTVVRAELAHWQWIDRSNELAIFAMAKWS
jgi:hypothetical protein